MKIFFLVLVLPVLGWSSSELLRYQFPRGACTEDGFLRGCFKVSESDCREAASASYASCEKFITAHNKRKRAMSEKISVCVLRELSAKWKNESTGWGNCAPPEKEKL